jgi:hypothetical protein
MTTLGNLMATASTADDVSSLKALPIAYVLGKQGIEFVDQGDGHLYALCPFHDDHTPSFDVYGPKLERWGCFSCGSGGDVLDLIQKMFATSGFIETKQVAIGLLHDMVEDDWKGPVVGLKKVLDIDAVRRRVDAARMAKTGAIDTFLSIKQETNPGLAMDDQWLVDMFGLGESGTSVIIPYWDRAGKLVTLKHRTAHTKAISEPGSSFAEVLYGEWLDTDPRKTIVLCEGETDTWAATYALRDDYVALGIPTGVGSHPKQAELLNGRDVIICFDGDAAGRRGIERWHSALLAAGCTVRIAQMGDDLDIAHMTSSQITSVIEHARPAPLAPNGLTIQPGGMSRVQNQTSVPISNWSFEPLRELVDDSGKRSYEGIIHPMNVSTVITSDDLASMMRVKAWASRHGGAWYGSDRDAQTLLGILQARGPFLAVGRQGTVAGLHDNHFIFPGGCIGGEYWAYVAPPANVHLETQIKVKEGPWHASQVNILRTLHDSSVMDPLLAWLAIAPLRSLLKEFPILACTGSSGTGKTTLLETVLPAFTGSHITCNLTNTTNHSLFSFVGSSNAFPVHFDEYRPGARRDTLRCLEQILRDAYTSQASAKGGMGEVWSEVVSVSPCAPIIVSGEDAFSETSHTERMILLGLPLQGKNPTVLKEIQGWKNNGLPYAYLTFLEDGLRNGWLPQIMNYQHGDYALPNRQRTNMGVLDLGWSILNSFVVANGGGALGNPNFDLILHESTEAAKHNPIYDALMWCRDEPDAMDFMRILPGDREVFIRVENFVEFIVRRQMFPLPGGATAVRKYLKQHFGAVKARITLNGRQASGYLFPADIFKD